ncbi:uncharacterized protein LOC6547077 [Drosophila erecta]|uniref:Uncharacterized protein n=1 Tax=Drosophila erecta TaxID=7220 RepID=A0A0Q5VMI7_DROER|nr:uncharacterized protein LOC6547077 [Drosophila erecta]KQS62545.1 uncharacterized protein Dere_GG22353 [Drosophila erecta]
MAYIRNFLNSPIGWTRLNENINEIKGLTSCFYFFSLKTGCKMIAVFEAVVSVLQMFTLHMTELEIKTTTTESPDSLLVTREPDGDMLGPNTMMPMFESNLYFQRALCSLTVFRSLLLIIGAECSHLSCLVLWICIAVITLLISTCIDIMQYGDLPTLFISTISIFLEIYFCAVVASLVLKLQKKLRRNVEESEVLYTRNEEV